MAYFYSYILHKEPTKLEDFNTALLKNFCVVSQVVNKNVNNSVEILSNKSFSKNKS